MILKLENTKIILILIIVLFLLRTFYFFSSKNEDKSAPAPDVKAPRKLKFNITFPELKNNIEEAVENIDS